MSELLTAPHAATEADSPVALERSGVQTYLGVLREEVQAAGRTTRWVRLGLDVGAAATVVSAAPVLLDLARGLGFHLSAMPWAHREQLVALAVVAAMFASRGVSAALTAGYRRLRRGQLRDKLARFSPLEQGEVLLPLRADPSEETRKLVDPLLREMGLPTEVAPAPALGEGTGW